LRDTSTSTLATGRVSVASQPVTMRCAIYTRKSTEEGLEQEFNSLDAQREAAEAFITSQRHEGWVARPERYDDGGFTGGNMERPALKRLLADIEAGGVDCVVVYKVDRLSRSLLDFARIMEVFEGHHVSFVSVTQQFNTSTSLGRLMLNVLLSFAQFEREIIAERTRDKMSAARRKGKWTGGTPILGYDLQDARLLVNDDEAEQVRAIFELYLERRSLIAVARELDRRGWLTKRHVSKRGRETGGKPYTKSALSRLLSNAIYTGKVNYRGVIYEGEHEPIVEPELWHRVQQLLRLNGRTGGKDVRNKYGAFLRGLLFCEPCGKPMVHTYTAKGGKRYRYYVCSNAQQRGWASCPTKSVPAHDIEASVLDQVRRLGSETAVVAETLRHAREQSSQRASELERERRALGSELTRLNAELRKLAGEVGMPADETMETERLADVQDRIRTIEQRITCIREELISLQRGAIDEKDLAKALSLFDPVWDSLSSVEQCRVMRLLVERVDYDGRTGKMTASFRTGGIRELCGEADLFRDQEAR